MAQAITSLGRFASGWTAIAHDPAGPSKPIFRFEASCEGALISHSNGDSGLGLYRRRLLRKARAAHGTSARGAARHGSRRRWHSASLGPANRICLQGDRRPDLAPNHIDRCFAARDLVRHCKRLAFAPETGYGALSTT